MIYYISIFYACLMRNLETKMFQQDGVEASSALWAYHLREFCLTRVIKYIVVIGKVKYGYPMI